MAQAFPETAHLNTDRKKFGENYDHIFNRDRCECEECREVKMKQRVTTEAVAECGKNE